MHDIDALGWATGEQGNIIPPPSGERPKLVVGAHITRLGRIPAMHTVELLEEAIDLARRWGFVVREDWFGGLRSGACQFHGRQWLFLDLALSPIEQLDVVLAALDGIPTPPQSVISRQLQSLLARRKAA